MLCHDVGVSYLFGSELCNHLFDSYAPLLLLLIYINRVHVLMSYYFPLVRLIP
jgi:hypothetical protein